MLADLDDLMHGLHTLSSGLNLNIIIPAGKLAELLDHVKMKLMEYFKKYELLMTEIHQYYDLPLVSYSYTDDICHLLYYWFYLSFIYVLTSCYLYYRWVLWVLDTYYEYLS